MDDLERIFFFTASLSGHASVRAFISFMKDYIDITTDMAPYVYRSIFVPLSAHIGTRFGIYGILIPSIKEGGLQDRLNLIKETDILGAITTLLKDSAEEVAKNLPDIWRLPETFDSVKSDVENVASRIFKERQVMWIETDTFETMNLLTLGTHYENISVSLMEQKGDFILDMEEKIGYLSTYKRLVAETMLAYAFAPLFAHEYNTVAPYIAERIMPMIQDIIVNEDAEKLLKEKSPILTYPYNIVKNMLT